MENKKREYNDDLVYLGSSGKGIFWLGGICCIFLILYCIATMFIMMFIGPPPATIDECYTMLSKNKFFGFLRLDILTVFVMPLYYLLFYSIYKALKKANKNEILNVSLILIFTGLTLFLATPSVFSYVDLSDKYAAATSEIQRSQLIAAGEAILASDMWHGTGARIGGMLLQTGAVLISAAMLKQKIFGKLTAYTGIATHGLDLLHILVGFFLPAVGDMIMYAAGPLYLLWLPLVGNRLLRLGTIQR